MTREQYTHIKEYLRDIIRGTEFENHVMTVGGCVRDELMNVEIKDIDLCVSLPDGGIRFAEWLKGKHLTTKGVTVYPSFGTAMLHLKAFPRVELEFVQTRREKYIDHSCRNPLTAFGTLREDCLRRDLTINALYCNLSTGEIIDITGHGVSDIRDHIIRTPADPDLTYDDDPLRILRCIRFASRYGWAIEEETMAGMKRNAFRLEIITKERVHDEFCRMLTCRFPVMALRLLRKTGAMHYVIPEMEETYDAPGDGIPDTTLWEYTLRMVQEVAVRTAKAGEEEQLILALSALLQGLAAGQGARVTHPQPAGHADCRDVIDRILRTLKFSNEHIASVYFLISHLADIKARGDRCERLEDKELRRLQYTCKTEERFRHLMTLVRAGEAAKSLREDGLPSTQADILLARTEQMKAEGTALFGFKGFLSGHEVMQVKGLAPGPAVRECLDYLLELALSAPLMSREQAVRHLLDYELETSSL